MAGYLSERAALVALVARFGPQEFDIQYRTVEGEETVHFANSAKATVRIVGIKEAVRLVEALQAVERARHEQEHHGRKAA